MTNRLFQIGFACLLSAAPALAQGTIRIETPLVNLNVRVMDGAGRNPVKRSFNELLERTAEEDVTIYPLYFDTEYEMVDLGKGRETRETFVIARRQLNDIAEQTGGTMFRVNRIEDLKDVYERVAAELRALYSMAFSPDKQRHDGSFRKVAVKVRRDGARVKTRRGYV